MVLKIVLAKPPTMTDANRMGKGVPEKLCEVVYKALMQINTSSAGSLEKLWALQDLMLAPSQVLAIGAPPAVESVFVAAQKRRMADQRANSGWDNIEKPEVKITHQHAEQVMQKFLSGYLSRANQKLKDSVANLPPFNVVTGRAKFEALFKRAPPNKQIFIDDFEKEKENGKRPTKIQTKIQK